MSRTPRHKVVVITGASSGIGRGAAHALAARGDQVVVAARSAGNLDEVVAECRELGGTAVSVPTDVSDETAVQALAQRAVMEFGRIDAWVNAAAVWSYGRFEDTPSAVFRQIVDTTLFGQIHAARAALPQFRSQGYGVLVNVGSLYGRVSSPYVAPYVTSKWGLLGFSEVLRQELRASPDIAVCVILPGAVDTPIYRHAANYVGRDIRPLPPVASPERVVSAVVRAVDHPKAQIIVGQTHHVGAWAHQFAPRLYDRLVGPIVRLGALQQTTTDDHDGNVFAADADINSVDDGWRKRDHRRIARILSIAAGAATVVGVARRASTSRISERN